MAATITLSQSEQAQVESMYSARQARTEHPAGVFDKRGRWYASESERQSCCDGIRSPSAAYPYSEMTHCRSKRHCAHVVASRRPLPEIAYKAVAVAPDGVLRSIYDGETEYAAGVTLTQEVGAGHGGGYYCYETAEQARDAEVPVRSKLYDAERVVIQCRVGGQYVRYGDKIAVESLTPLAIVG